MHMCRLLGIAVGPSTLLR